MSHWYITDHRWKQNMQDLQFLSYLKYIISYKKLAKVLVESGGTYSDSAYGIWHELCIPQYRVCSLSNLFTICIINKVYEEW